MPNASHNDLADRFEGSWKLSDSTGRKFGGQFPARITIEKHLIHKSRKRTELTAYIGSLELEGLSAYIVAKDLGSKSHIIGPCLKTTFAWVTVPDTAGSHQEGSLDIFFDGSKIDGYLSGSSVPRPIAFRGLPGLVRSAATDTRKESNDLWNAYHRALSKVSKNKRKGAKRGSRDQRSKSEY